MIRKAVIPAAGFGTRFLPATKSQPKEMLPIVDTPTIQYVVQEAVDSGITDIIMVIGKGKRAIEEHFDRSFQLETQLVAQGKSRELELIRHISDMANIHFVWQKELRGLGDAVYCARHHVGDEPFVVLLGDTVIRAEVPAVSQLMNVFERYQESTVLLEEVDRSMVSRYGVIDGREIEEGLFLIKDLVEKPDIDDAPSNLVIASRYALTPDIFEHLSATKPGKGDEIQLTDAMRSLVAEKAMYGLRLNGKRYDVGNKLGFLKTNIEFALQRDDIAAELRAFIRALAKTLPE
ncbi:MAG: UTP--glucose-1-phosphate uridylyltransferase GalU [Phycisphaerae bacterium]|jgi:UTP--glucose-1-phosphate uridylyltransferase|nr:UTP--glucose-1-phosphate uridylyltransferase GalU [Phycisphaerae bacterium]